MFAGNTASRKDFADFLIWDFGMGVGNNLCGSPQGIFPYPVLFKIVEYGLIRKSKITAHGRDPAHKCFKQGRFADSVKTCDNHLLAAFYGKVNLG